MGKRSGSLSSDDLSDFFSDSDSDMSTRSEKRHRSEKKKKDKSDKKKSKKEKSDKKEKKDKSDKKEKKDKSDKKEKKDKSEKTKAQCPPATASSPSAAPVVRSILSTSGGSSGGGISILGVAKKSLLTPAVPSAAAVASSSTPSISNRPPSTVVEEKSTSTAASLPQNPASASAHPSTGDTPAAVSTTQTAAAAATTPSSPVANIVDQQSQVKKAEATPTTSAAVVGGGAGISLLSATKSLLSASKPPIPTNPPATTAATAAPSLQPPTETAFSNNKTTATAVAGPTASTTTTATALAGAPATSNTKLIPPPSYTAAVVGLAGASLLAPPTSAAAGGAKTGGATVPTLIPPPPPPEDISHLVAPDQIAPVTFIDDDDDDNSLAPKNPEEDDDQPSKEGEVGGGGEKEKALGSSAPKLLATVGDAVNGEILDNDNAAADGNNAVPLLNESVCSTPAAPTFFFSPAVDTSAAVLTKLSKDNKSTSVAAAPRAKSGLGTGSSETVRNNNEDEDDDISFGDSDTSEDEEDEAAALAAFDSLLARVKQETVAQASGPSETEVLKAALAEDRNKLVASAAAAAAKQQEQQKNQFADSAGRGQLVMWADDETDAVDALAAKLKIPEADKETKTKIKKMYYVDHSQIDYKPIEKNFYIPPTDVAMLSEEEVKKLYKDLDGARVKGKNCPRPMKTWVGIGLKSEIVNLLREKNFTLPFAMQSLAMPVLMAGRDLLSIAKTGSGKTLAYTLPMIRHVVNQPRLGYKRGPVALVILPTHILAQQVYNVVIDFAKVSGLKVVASYGGSDLNTNIKQCIAGCDIMIATPGRLLDLCTNGSKGVVNLPDCSFVVVDEADRMFDSGFRTHVEAFLKNCRPDRQLALISATMCKEMKVVAKSLLSKDYIELSTGGKPSPSTNVTQHFDFFDQEEYNTDSTKKKVDLRLHRLLEILSAEWTSHEELDSTYVVSPTSANPQHGGGGDGFGGGGGATTSTQKAFVPPLFLIFVDRKTECDDLAVKLWNMGYDGKVGVLNSDSTPDDQQHTISRFNPHDRPILIATGSAERGLDVYGLDFVINYWMPDHYEAYVHRVGRTGRAGKRGRAHNFFIKNVDDPLAQPIIEGLELAGHDIPEGLWERYNIHRERVKNGEYTGPSNYKKGFGSGKTYKFSSKNEKKQFRDDLKACGMADLLSSDDSDDVSNADSDDEVTNKFHDPEIFDATETAAGAAGGGVDGSKSVGGGSSALVAYKGGVVAFSSATSAAIEASKNFAALATAMHQEDSDLISGGNGASSAVGGGTRMFESKYVINDLPQFERYAVLRTKLLEELQEETKTTITRKGEYIDRRSARGKKISSDVQPLYLEIRGETRESLTRVFRALEAAQKEARRRSASKLTGVNKNVEF